jgi:hypothetical protein
MDVKIIRLDYVFSYWIFTWFLLYYVNIIKYNPKFVLILGLIENFFIIIYLLINKSKLYKISKFIIINIIIKVIPLYLIFNDEVLYKDIYATIILFLIYLIWIYINCGINCFYNVYQKLVYSFSFIKNNEITYLSYVYDNIARFLCNKKIDA